MIAKSSIWQSFVANLELENEQDGASHELEKDRTDQMNQYHLCVDEIKNEGNVLGSLEMHDEAMRRLNQRLGKDLAPSPRASEERRKNNCARRLRTKQLSHPIQANVLTRSIIGIGLMVTGKHGHDASDPSKVKMAGRRASTFKPVEFDEGITALQVLEDLDLSESEDEGVAAPTHSPSEMVESGNNSVGRRPSFMRRGGSNISRPLRSAVRRYSKRRSLDLSNSEDEGVGPPTHSPGNNVKRGRSGERRASLMRRGSANISRPLRSAVRRYSKSRSSIDGVGLAVASNSGPRTPNDAGECKGGIEEGVVSDMEDGKPSMIDGGRGEISDARETPVVICRKPHCRLGRRRSSLFSVHERISSANRSSLSSSGSTLKGSLTGSFSGKDGNGSLICSFGAQDYVQDGSLICDWERRRSMLSDSSVLSIQDGLDAPGPLICGWDDQTQLKKMSCY